MFRAYQAGGFFVAQVLIPAWLVHYYVKYHVMVRAGLPSASRGSITGLPSLAPSAGCVSGGLGAFQVFEVSTG